MNEKVSEFELQRTLNELLAGVYHNGDITNVQAEREIFFFAG